MKIQVRTTLNTAGLDGIVKRLPDKIQEGLIDTGEEIIKDIRAHWSAIAPSQEGAAPAKVSGDLDLSLEAKPYRGAGGAVFQVTIVAGARYAKYLEFGTKRMAKRPFFRPAVKRAKETLRAKLKIVFDKV